MELKVQLKVSANEVFEQLLYSIIQDIRNSIGQDILSDKLQKGFFYKKNLRNHLGNEGTVKVIISELISPTRYSAVIENPKGTNTIDYILSGTTEGVEITYKENYKSSSVLQNWNYFFASLVYVRGSKKKKLKQFAQLEQQILNSRNNSSKEEGK